MPTELTPAPEVQAIARELIPQYHKHLTQAVIAYVFTNQTRHKHGAIVLGTAQKLGVLDRYLSTVTPNALPAAIAPIDFVIIIGQTEWQELTAAQRKALVDHELCHCTRADDDEEGVPKWGIRAHSVEAFTEEVQRHGLWKPDVLEFGQVIRQLELPSVASTATVEYARTEA